MNKREIIIILVAVLIGVYGVFDFFILSDKSKTNSEQKIELEKNQVKAFEKIASASLQAIQSITDDPDLPYLLTMVESNWKNDPFITDQFIERHEKEEKKIEDIPELVYSGFIKAGNNIMAVVNGMEYIVGESLKEIGYKIHRITPSRIVLLTDADKEIILTLEEN